ncbi:MAG: hypothetical protein PHG63_01530 [Candidatus Dojkabacteria bacterium]|nr:hypothetical protein [Candidatus Dojkabacteria bacterium]
MKAQNPSILREILQRKRKELVALETDIVGILPFLKEDFHKERADADFHFYPGVEGFKRMYRTDEELGKLPVQRYTWDVLMPMDVIGPDFMNELVNRQLVNEKRHPFRPREIVSLNDWTRHFLSYQYNRDHEYLNSREIRFIDDPTFDIGVELTIVGEHILIACARRSEVWGLKMRSELLSATLRSIFMMQWRLAVPVTSELVDSWGPSEMLDHERKQNKKKKEKRVH